MGIKLVGNAEGKVKSNDTMKVKITLPEIKGIDKFMGCSMSVDCPLIKEDAVQLTDSEVNMGSLERSFQIKEIEEEKETNFNVVFGSKEISGVHGTIRVIASK